MIIDRIALVTGAGKGTGRALAEACAARGWIVAANDVTPVNLDETVSRIAASQRRVKAYVEDIAKKMPVQTLINSILDDWGRLDILINCAEVEPRAAVLNMDDWDWQRTLDVNLTGAFLLTQVAGRIMRAAGGGVIVHVGPRAHSRENRAAYLASKAGLVAFVRQAADEFNMLGIRVHCVLLEESPDVVQTVLSLCEKAAA